MTINISQAIIDIPKRSAVKFIILIGITSLLADFTYEGARSITGPYLAILGASAIWVGFVAGFGELLGYGLRLFSGYFSDKTGRYWVLTFAGYIINLGAVPMLAFAGSWQWAALLMILERSGKAIRTPARDAMLSHACNCIGAGWGFGLHEALDQFGAMLGPLVVAVVLYFHGGYQLSFALLAIPAFFTLIVLTSCCVLYPRPQNLDIKKLDIETGGIKPAFWIYLIGGALIAAGYADFPLIAYHFAKTDILTRSQIPLAYALAMAASATSALCFGYLYDRIGPLALIIMAILSAFFAPLVFLGYNGVIFIGVMLWGIGMGTQSSLMKAIIVRLVPSNRRGSGYGLYNTAYGVAWFLGSILIGWLYEISLPMLVAFSMVAQLAAIPFFIKVLKRM